MRNVITYLTRYATEMGAQLIYAALLLFYAYQHPGTPKWAKSTILGSIGYLLSPIDAIPDLTPFIGFTDDLGVVMFGVVTIACYIDKEIREKAKARLLKLFPNVTEEAIQKVDERL